MSLGRDLTTVGSATLLSRLLGFVRDMGIAALLGAGVLSDAYFAALQIPNLFRRLLAEGAVNSAFVPMWMRLREQHGAATAQRFGESAIGALVTALGGFALVSFVFAPAIVHLIAPGFAQNGERHLLAVDYLRLSIPYLFFVGLVAIAAAVLNAQARVGAAAFGIVVFNAVLLAAVALVFVVGGNATPLAGSILSASVAFAGLAQLVLVGGALLRLKDAPRRPRLEAPPQLRRFLVQALPGVIAAGIPQLKFVSAAIIVSSSQAAVSWLYYANRLYELPLGVASVAIASVMVPRISASRRAQG